MRNYWKTREERKRERSEAASHAANVRWEREHAEKIESDYDRRYDRPDEMYEITFKNLMTKESHVLLLHPGPRVDNFRIDVDGKFWKIGGWTKTLDRFRKSCNRI